MGCFASVDIGSSVHWHAHCVHSLFFIQSRIICDPNPPSPTPSPPLSHPSSNASTLSFIQSRCMCEPFPPNRVARRVRSGSTDHLAPLGSRGQALPVVARQKKTLGFSSTFIRPVACTSTPSFIQGFLFLFLLGCPSGHFYHENSDSRG